MSKGIVIPSPKQTELPELENQLRFWRNLLANPELVEKTFFFNDAEYSDTRTPEGKRHWLTGKMALNFADAHKWKRVTESYKGRIISYCCGPSSAPFGRGRSDARAQAD